MPRRQVAHAGCVGSDVKRWFKHGSPDGLRHRHRHRHFSHPPSEFRVFPDPVVFYFVYSLEHKEAHI